MGKRSNFERREADFYPTPQAAVAPLIPYLRKIRTFAEPCAGDGDLVRHLEAHGLRCVYAGDIRTGQDALAADSYGVVDAIITNPPFKYPGDPKSSTRLLFDLIRHFLRIGGVPTWLLMPHDWSANKGSAPYLRHCSDIVPIGRVKWIANSEYSGGMENSCWYGFDARHTNGPVFHSRGQDEPTRRTRACDQCGKAYEIQRSDSRTCSDACRQRLHRSAVAVTPSVTSEGEFRYVRHADIPKFMAKGWELLNALDGTHHGYYSALMRRALTPLRRLGLDDSRDQPADLLRLKRQLAERGRLEP
jgi:hypothetical protein